MDTLAQCLAWGPEPTESSNKNREARFITSPGHSAELVESSGTEPSCSGTEPELGDRSQSQVGDQSQGAKEPTNGRSQSAARSEPGRHGATQGGVHLGTEPSMGGQSRGANKRPEPVCCPVGNWDGTGPCRRWTATQECSPMLSANLRPPKEQWPEPNVSLPVDDARTQWMPPP